MIGKTYFIPGVTLLLFIITAKSRATTLNSDIYMNLAQGWLAIGFWAFSAIVFIIIKLFMWD